MYSTTFHREIKQFERTKIKYLMVNIVMYKCLLYRNHKRFSEICVVVWTMKLYYSCMVTDAMLHVILQSLWLEDGISVHDGHHTVTRCSVCSANGQLCVPLHHLPRGPSYPYVIRYHLSCCLQAYLYVLAGFK